MKLLSRDSMPISAVLRQIPWLAAFLWAAPAFSQEKPQQIDIAPEIINNSPVLQRWLQNIPDVGAEIQNDPSFRPRVRVGYSQYPASGQSGGWDVSVNEVLIGRSGVALNADYHGKIGSDRSSYGVEANYYLLPLGGYYNVAPVVGYRRINSDLYQREGVNLGAKVILVPARGGGGDITLQQTWLNIGTPEEVGIGSISTGYALTNQLRISGEIQFQNSRESQESRVGIGLEWMP
jgi:hypothetical protein